jgi:tetratricopeptide (TPR) repeat protein
MKNYLLPLFFLFFGFQMQSQNILLFPESTAYTSGELPAGICVKMSSELIKSIDVSDTASVKLLRTLGRRLMRLGYHDYAKDAFEKLLDINSKAYPKTDERYIWALVDLARSYLFLIRYDEMGPMYEQAADLMAKAKGANSYERALILSESVEPNFYLGDNASSLRQAERVLDILSKMSQKNELAYAITLNNIGSNKLYTIGFEKGMADLQKAFNILNNPKYPKQYVIAVAANMAEAYAKNGDQAKAQALLDAYLPMAWQSLNEKITSYARIWLQLGQAHASMKNYEGAETCFKKAYITNSLTYSEIKDIAAEADNLFFKNQFLATCAQAGTTMYAIFLFKDKFQSTKDLKALKDAYLLVNVMGKFKSQLQESYTSEKNKLMLYRLGATTILETGVELAYELYQQTGEKHYLEEAFSLSENGKSTLLVHALRSKESKQFGNLPESLIAEEAALKAKLKAAEKRLIEADGTEKQKQVRDEVNVLNRDFLRFKEVIAKQYPNYYKHHMRNEQLSIKAIQAKIPEGTALIEYALGEWRSFAFILTHNSFDMVDLRIDYN